MGWYCLLDAALQVAAGNARLIADVGLPKMQRISCDSVMRAAAGAGHPPVQLKCAHPLLAGSAPDETDETDESERVLIKYFVDSASGCGEPSALFLRILMLAGGLCGFAPEPKIAQAIWRTVEISEVEMILRKQQPALGETQPRFICTKIHDAATDEEGMRALYQLACSWKECKGDDRHLIVLLKELYHNPIFKALKQLPGMLDLLLTQLAAEKKRQIVNWIIARFEAHHEVKCRVLLDRVILKSVPVFQLFPSADQALRIRRNAFFDLDLRLDVINPISWFDFEGDILASEGLHEDLHEVVTSD
jgi:hypothetical protein